MAKLRIIEGPMRGRTFELKEECLFIGGASESGIQITDGGVSKKHVKLFRIEDMYFVEDLDSSSGTFINGEFIRPGEGYQIDEEDIISIGSSLIRLEDVAPTRGPDLGDAGNLSSSEGQAQEDASPKERRSRSRDHLGLINEVSELLRQPLEIREIFQKVLQCLLKTLPRVDRAAILLFSPQKGQILDVVVWTRQGRGHDKSSFSNAVASRVLETGNPLQIPDTIHDAPADFWGDMEALNIRSAVCAPVVRRSETIGAIYADSIKRHNCFRKEDLLLLQALSGPVGVVLENIRLSSGIRRLKALHRPPRPTLQGVLAAKNAYREVYSTGFSICY